LTTLISPSKHKKITPFSQIKATQGAKICGTDLEIGVQIIVLKPSINHKSKELSRVDFINFFKRTKTMLF
jgi:hypothetical protein